MGDVMEIECKKALLQRKVLWCLAVDNFCACQRHCARRGHAILTEEAKTCKYRIQKEKDNGF
jgi:hypothetical protein